jgi:rsbT co-antagonist protein RsbR
MAQLQAENAKLKQRIAELEQERTAAPATPATTASQSPYAAFQADELELFRTILESSPDNILIWDEHYNYLYANQAAIDQVGTTRDKVIGKNMRDGLGHVPDFMRLWMSRVDHVIATGETVHREESMQIGDSMVTGIYTMFPVRDKAGRVYAMGLVYRDITERKQQEQELRLFKQLVENSPDGIGIGDQQGVFTYTNRAYQTMTGYGEDLNGMPAGDVVAPGEIDVGEVIGQALEHEHGWLGEVTYQRKDGSQFPVQVSVFATRDTDGQMMGLAAIVRDITERKQQEEELRLTRAALDRAADMVLWHDMHGQIVYVNEATCRSLGYTREELFKLQAPDLDPNFTKGSAHELWNTVKAQGFLSLETSHRRKDGSTFPSEMTINVLQYGAQEYICVFARDITERKQQEEALKHSEARHRALLDAVPDMMFIQRSDSTFLDYRAPRGNTLLPPEQFLGKRNDEVFPPDLAQQLTDAIQQALQSQEPLMLEYTLSYEDAPHYFEARISPIDDDTVMALVRDTTEKKQAVAEREALQQQVIDAQRNALRELSTPLIPISNDVVIMPLIGTIDSQRAQQVMEALLEGVAQHQARLVILDITGVAVVDTQVAQAFIQAAQAVRLLGAQVMLTGIQPQIAQTLVHLGVDLSGIITSGSLQSGIAAALQQ